MGDYELYYLLWFNFFTLNPLLSSSIFFRYLIELSLFGYIPLMLFSNYKGIYMYRLYVIMIGCNTFTLLILLSYFSSVTIDLNFNLLSSWYILWCKFLTLIIFSFMLFIIKIKIMEDLDYLSELISILNFMLLFIFVILSSFDFMMAYISIEGTSLTLYVLGAFLTANLISIESIIKYFLLNSVASSIMLFGISLIFGVVGSLDFLEIQSFLGADNFGFLFNNLYLIFFFSLFGFFFKLSFFPFNWWVADVYEGLWTPATLCFAVFIKFTFFLLFFRIIFNLFFSLIFLFQPFFLISSISSILIGAIGAYNQARIKRFLAYTSVSQVGYVLIGLSCCTLNGLVSAFLYLILYVIVSLGFFLILLNTNHISTNQNAIFFHDFLNLSRYNRYFSYYLGFIIINMATFPPMSTFFSKVFIYICLLESKLDLFVFLVMIINVISAVYYLRFLQDIFFFNNNFSSTIRLFIFKTSYILYIFIIVSIVILNISWIVFPIFFNFFINLLVSCLFPFYYT